MTDQEQLSEGDLKELEAGASMLQVSDEVVIRIQNMHKWYGSFHVLKNINLEVIRGERRILPQPNQRNPSSALG